MKILQNQFFDMGVSKYTHPPRNALLQKKASYGLNPKADTHSRRSSPAAVTNFHHIQIVYPPAAALPPALSIALPDVILANSTTGAAISISRFHHRGSTMFGTPRLPYETYAIDNLEYIARYSPDASDAFHAATGRPLAHLELTLAVINPDRPGTITLKADHYYDPPPFRTAEEAGRAIATFLEDRQGPRNPYSFPSLRDSSGTAYELPPPLDPTN
ncbi:MAG: hypothetical protein JNN24_13625 [Hyphomicrobium zavarzinii]|uniref:hypothetical protein n=1 Tax=Hyphomicrobium zavarzinii TaxID=48292 RepID=UPI0012EB898D|nr:hypothetical protein [Hyphomicrobium zavarzinii]MBL8846804.1 hypothetical protein [Hyphomicrobium zavarzinii]